MVAIIYVQSPAWHTLGNIARGVFLYKFHHNSVAAFPIIQWYMLLMYESEIR
jgi:hypothetical protein